MLARELSAIPNDVARLIATAQDHLVGGAHQKRTVRKRQSRTGAFVQRRPVRNRGQPTIAISAVSLTVLFPISINGLGPREGILAAAVAGAGFNSEAGAALGPFWFAMQLVTRLAATASRFMSFSESGDELPASRTQLITVGVDGSLRPTAQCSEPFDARASPPSDDPTVQSTSPSTQLGCHV